MPARHTSLQNDLLPKSRFEPAALVDERGCRRDIRSNGWIVFPKEFALSENRSGRRNKFSSFGADPCDPQFHRRSNAQVKSGPDVFADALVLLTPQPLRRGAQIFNTPTFDLSLEPPHGGGRLHPCPGRSAALLCCSAGPGPTAMGPGSAAHHADGVAQHPGTRPFRWLSFPEMPG
jgi:hypothetical protein